MRYSLNRCQIVQIDDGPCEPAILYFSRVNKVKPIYVETVLFEIPRKKGITKRKELKRITTYLKEETKWGYKLKTKIKNI